MITVIIYPAGGLITRRKWRFSIRGGNGEIIATSGSQSYFNKGDLYKTLHLIFGAKEVRVRDLSDGTVTVLGEEYLRGGK